MKLEHLYYNIRIRLILVITLIIIFIATVISYVLYNYSNHFLKEKMANLTTDSLLKYSNSLGNMLQDVYYVAVKTVADQQVIELVESIQLTSDPQLEYELYRALQNEAGKNTYIQSMYVYIEGTDQIVTSNSLRKIKRIYNFENYPWISKGDTAASHLLSLVEYRDNVGVFDSFFYSVVKPIRNENKETIGIISVNISSRKIYEDFLVNIIHEDESNVMLVNKDGNIIYHNQPEMLMTNINKNESYNRMSNYSKGYYVEEINGIQTLVVFVSEKYSQYKMVYAIPMDKISYGITNLRWLAVILSTISIIFGTIVVLAYSKSLYNPILTIKMAMLKFGQGDFDVRIQEKRKDEFQVLYKGFNNMIEELTRLIDETIAQKLKLKEEHYRTLQSQISPHFIYNTLNSIKCAAILQKDTKVTEMLQAFIELLQLSVDHKKDMISLNEEIKQISNYILLQKHRYGDLFSVEYEVNENVKTCLVPKLILQPLVENSLNYGVNLREGKGLICIQAFKVENGVIIEVNDNGEDADIDKLRQILRTKGQSKFSGIGIYNINERIKLIYGEEYGLSYEKGENGGLKAIVYLGDSTLKDYQIPKSDF
ncbi:MAG: histidine kinase [Clostridia bacterium]|nr:histidine kinase [Clostridia bacterium]